MRFHFAAEVLLSVHSEISHYYSTTYAYKSIALIIFTKVIATELQTVVVVALVVLFLAS